MSTPMMLPHMVTCAMSASVSPCSMVPCVLMACMVMSWVVLPMMLEMVFLMPLQLVLFMPFPACLDPFCVPLLMRFHMVFMLRPVLLMMLPVILMVLSRMVMVLMWFCHRLFFPSSIPAKSSQESFYHSRIGACCNPCSKVSFYFIWPLCHILDGTHHL